MLYPNGAKLDYMDKITIDTYNKQAQEYDQETKDFWARFPVPIIDEFVKRMLKGVKVLDLGSGPGRDGLILKERGLDMTCVDASSEMVRICRENGLRAMEGDALSLAFEDEAFDGVWSYTTLLHLKREDINVALREIKRVLKHNGVFGLGMIEGVGESYRESSGVGMPRLFCYYQRDELDKLLEKHGFDVIYYHEFQPGTKKYLNYITIKRS